MKDGLKFIFDIENDENLKKEFKDFMENHEINSEEEKIETIIEFAKKHDYEVDEGQIASEKANVKKKLADDDLLNISGGSNEKDRKTNCFANFLCAFIYNTCGFSNECKDVTYGCKQTLSEGDCWHTMDSGYDCKHVFASMECSGPYVFYKKNREGCDEDEE